MAQDSIPLWLSELEEDDFAFIKKFLFSSGSLKEVAKLYGVTYPTVRLRLDRLIQKIKMSEVEKGDDYITLIKKLAIDDRLDLETARLLITAYKTTKKESSL